MWRKIRIDIIQWKIDDIHTEDFMDYLGSRSFILGRQSWSPPYSDEEIGCECAYFDNVLKEKQRPAAVLYKDGLFEIPANAPDGIMDHIRTFNSSDVSGDIEHFRKHYKK
jgi:hypothetical protein